MKIENNLNKCVGRNLYLNSCHYMKLINYSFGKPGLNRVLNSSIFSLFSDIK